MFYYSPKIHDDFALAIPKNNTIGHRNSLICWYFVQNSMWQWENLHYQWLQEMSAKARKNWMVICVYTFRGKQNKHYDRLIIFFC